MKANAWKRFIIYHIVVHMMMTKEAFIISKNKKDLFRFSNNFASLKRKKKSIKLA